MKIKTESYDLGNYEIQIEHYEVTFDPLRLCIWPKSLICVAFTDGNMPDVLIKGSTDLEIAEQMKMLYVGIDVAKIAIKSKTYYVKVVGGELKKTGKPTSFIFVMEVEQALDALHIEQNVESFYQALVGMLSETKPMLMYGLSVFGKGAALLHQHKYYYGEAGYQLAKCHAQYIVKRYQHH